MQINISELEFVRAGSDYLGMCWSANVTGYDFKLHECYEIIRNNGTSYNAYPVKKQKMKGVMTFLIVDEDGAMMFN